MRGTCMCVCMEGVLGLSDRRRLNAGGGKVEKDCAVMPAAIRAVALAI